MQDSIRKVACYTKEEQALYESLNYKQRNYVDLRAVGVPKSEAYKRAGYTTKNNCSVNACQLEAKSPIKELIEKQLKSRVAKELFTDNVPVAEKVERLDNLKEGEISEELMANSNGELAKQLKFYLNIASGKIKTIKKTTTTNPKGEVTIKEEVIDDVNTRIKARQKVDELLGLNAQREIGQVKAGPITIKIVDASKREEPKPLNVDITKEEDEEVIDAEILNQSLMEEE